MGRRSSKSIAVTVTHLEMRQEKRGLHVLRPSEQIALMRAECPPVHFYRYLYNTVGEAYYWLDRRRISDKKLSSIIHSPATEIYILYVHGCPGGYFEWDFSHLPDRAILSYFGLFPENIGRGLGQYMLSEAIGLGWRREPERLSVQTCSLDHHAALHLYQRMGFEAVSQEQCHIEPLPNMEESFKNKKKR